MPETVLLDSEAETEALGRRLAPHLAPGDTILLSGPVGAGKSVLARAILAARLAAEDTARGIPSPSYTLVQTYEAGDVRLWHADLYRMSGPEEVPELGLEAAYGDAILLVEWPDRLGPLRPARHLEIALETDPAAPDRRRATLRAAGSGWDAVAAAAARAGRGAARAAFLDRAGAPGAALAPLAGDASARRYFRVAPPPGGVLMDWAGEPEGTARFAAVTARLRALGLSAPAIRAEAAAEGLLWLEDLGDAVFAAHLRAHPDEEMRLYLAAIDLLVELQAAPPGGLPPYSEAILREEAGRFLLWYLPGATGTALPRAEAAAFEAMLAEAVAELPPEPAVPVLVDYHAENLVWLPERAGVARVGLLDYQDARAGHPAYDPVSLLEDARRDVAPAVRGAAVARFAERTGRDAAAVEAAMAVWGAQRNLKILGVFARLARRDGKTRYLELMPRVWAHLERDLAHPALAPLAAWLAERAPPPDARVRARLGAGG